MTIKPIHLIIACHHNVASIGGVPINEFTTEGLLLLCISHTLPYQCGRFLRATPESGYHWQILQASDDDNRFAKHTRFRLFALNTEMRWRALLTGRVYVKQHPGDAQLSLDELRYMVGREGQTFSNCVSTVSESSKTFLTVICCSQKLACTSV